MKSVDEIRSKLQDFVYDAEFFIVTCYKYCQSLNSGISCLTEGYCTSSLASQASAGDK